jgi:4-methylaminobutanoate oxidase (formaldehyde-forming)
VGAWTKSVVPLHACEHYYIVTEPIPDLPPSLPVLRDVDNALYFKEDAGKLLIGATELEAKPWGMLGIPDDFCFDELAPDHDHFLPYLEAALGRLPALRNVGIRRFFNGPESFTPDHRMHIGPIPGVRNYFVAAGLNTVGIQGAAGVGRMLCEWIVEGAPSIDVSDSHVRRNLPFQAGRRFLYDRSVESVGVFNDVHWPYKQMTSARGARQSPLHERLAAAHAYFGETNGWERPLWFAPERSALLVEYSFGRQNWFDYSAGEHRAVRERVGVLDYSAFAKLELRGRDAERILNRISTASVSVPIGTVVYTPWLNENGGIETDLTIVRTGELAFLILASCAGQARDYHWLHDHIPADAHASLSDVTSTMAGLAVMGPCSRDLLAQLTSSDLSNAGFPYGTSALIDLGPALVRAVRISFAGELGFELFMPAEVAVGVFDRLMASAAEQGARLVGLHALGSLRIEKAYKDWGHDMTPEDTPLEAGLSFALDLAKPGGFIGREALLRQKDRGIRRRLVQFLLEATAPFAHHDEPIYRDGERVGHVTSGMYGHTLGGWVCIRSKPHCGRCTIPRANGCGCDRRELADVSADAGRPSSAQHCGGSCLRRKTPAPGSSGSSMSTRRVRPITVL